MSGSQIQELGFAIFTDVLGRNDMDRLAQGISHAPLPRSRAGIRHAMRHQAVLEVARDARLLRIAKEILGRDPCPFRATLFDKSYESNWLVVWHQDTALPLRERHEIAEWGPWSVKDGVIYAHAPASALSRVIALRLHLDDSLLENGPLRVLPRTHEMGVLGDNEIHALSEQITAVDCLVPRGGILAMRPLIVHASSKSRSDTPRRVLHIEYAPTATIGEGLELAIS
jgi:ectoine hydroxylase-related dioxygenase (phytanoyl-CoA dioxygenase family)